MRIRLFPAVALLVLSVPWAAAVAAADTDVTVNKVDDVFEVFAESRVAAPPALAWEVLTDYENFASFVPNLSLSRVVDRKPLRIEQHGQFGILFFRKDVHVILEVDERPRTRIAFRALSGDLRLLDTEVDVESSDIGAVIRYRSRITPDFWVPPLIGAPLVRSAMRNKLQAVAVEIERRVAGKKPK